jgi:hypothetical protein
MGSYKDLNSQAIGQIKLIQVAHTGAIVRQTAELLKKALYGDENLIKMLLEPKNRKHAWLKDHVSWEMRKIYKSLTIRAIDRPLNSDI